MHTLFFGLTGGFSLPPLEALVSAGFNIPAIILPAPRQLGNDIAPRRIEPVPTRATDLPLLDPFLTPNIVHVAWKQQIPVWEVAGLDRADTLRLLAEFQPDVIVVACFSRIFPEELLGLPRWGCLNLHPSLLPAYRGPEPLFWIARNDERVSGVTLHFLNPDIDSGDIVSQTHIDRPDGLSGAALEQKCALEGASLLVAALQRLREGKPLPHRKQLETEASYYAWPQPSDLVIPTTWPAQRAFNFVRGAEAWPLSVDVAGQHFAIQTAVAYDAQLNLEQPYVIDNETLLIRFQPGVLRVVARTEIIH